MAGSHQWSTGAALIYTGTGTNGAAEFFGTAEGFPRMELRGEFEAVMNDLSGSRVPLDYSFQGMSGAISLIMTRWDESVAQKLENMPDLFGGTRGEYNWADVGMLMALEDVAFPVWVQFIAAGRSALSGLPPGYHFHQAIVWSPQVIEPGTRPMKRHFQLLAWPKIDNVAKKFKLWDSLVTGLPAVS